MPYPVRFALSMMAMALATGSVPEKPRITVDDFRFGLLDLQFPGGRADAIPRAGAASYACLGSGDRGAPERQDEREGLMTVR